MDIRVPNNNMDWEKLLTHPNEKARSDKKINFHNGVLITLNLIHYQDNRRVLDLRPGYFASLNGSEMEKMFSKDGWGEIKKHLIHNHIIETNGSYEKGVSSLGYRLIITRQGPESIWMKLNEEGSVYKNFQKYLETNIENAKKRLEKVNYLIKQFENANLLIDSSVYDFIKAYQLGLFRLHESINASADSYYGILALIGGYLIDIEKFNTGENEPYISGSNNRLYSTINSIKKEIRYYIRNGNNSFIEYDLSSSFNYVLATILNYEFFTSTTTEYSLYNIFRIIYSRIENLNSIYINEQFYNISYMSPTYCEKEDIVRYKALPFEDDVYGWIGRMSRFENTSSQTFISNNRSEIKASFQNYFNLTESVIRKGKNIDIPENEWKGLPIVRFMEEHFPNVNKLITSLIYHQGITSPLSLLMQRCEAYLVQEKAAKHIIDLHPNQLVFTIHDSLFIEAIPDQNPQLIVQEMKDVLSEFTGIVPGVKNKSIDPITNINDIVNDDYEALAKNLKKSKITFLDAAGKNAILSAMKYTFPSPKDFKVASKKFKTYCKKKSQSESKDAI